VARPEIPIDSRTGPQAAFAVELREHAGLTYRVLAQRAHCSYGVLCEAARGHRLPTWQVTKAFVEGCGSAAVEGSLAGRRRRDRSRLEHGHRTGG
jgi:hypothetical protein